MGKQSRKKRARRIESQMRGTNADAVSTIRSDPNPRIRQLRDVFVVGRMPLLTYNPRPELRLEEQLRDYLNDRGTILSVSGPTKTGKTTLLKSVAPHAIWLSGGAIDSVGDFWRQVGDTLHLPTEVGESRESGEMESRVTEGGGSIGVINGKYASSSEISSASSWDSRRSRDPAAAAREALRGSLQLVVVDDFHYVEQQVQLGIVRGLKDLVFDGLGVIFASVPHRAYDAVRVEKEMTGRVTHLVIEAWTEDELATIARAGFAVLNVIDDGEKLTRRLAAESFGSPHLMQEFCKRLCRMNAVAETLPDAQVLRAPSDWTDFFQATAGDTSKMAFDMLAQGPRQRTDRIQRRLRDGRDVDIYVATLAAIAQTGPALSITYEQLRTALREVLTSEMPQRHEVTRVLDQMTQIARKRIEGEPVVEYDDEMSTLHISDPYFAFYLRWGRNRLEPTRHSAAGHN